MKSYTNLQQSQILAEILSHDTADQIYEHFTITKVKDAPKEMLYKHNGDVPFQICGGIGIPCWSLAALLNVLPKIIDKDYVINITQNSTNTWFITYDLFADRDCSFRGLISKSNSLVDACYEMILKLNERKLL